MKSTKDITYRIARRIIVAVVGSTVLLIGIVMIVTPGPALIVIPVGLGILGAEFAWARLWLRKIRRHLSDGVAKIKGNSAESHRERHRN